MFLVLGIVGALALQILPGNMAVIGNTFVRVARAVFYLGGFLSLVLWFPAWNLRSKADKSEGFSQLLFYAAMIFWFPVGGFIAWWALGNKGRPQVTSAKPQPVIQADR